MCGGGKKNQTQPAAAPKPPVPKPEYSLQDGVIRNVTPGPSEQTQAASFGSELGSGGQ